MCYLVTALYNGLKQKFAIPILRNTDLFNLIFV